MKKHSPKKLAKRTGIAREAVKPGPRRIRRVKIGNTGECLKMISAAIAKRAYEIYERQARPGCDRENWLLAEREILQPLSCGVLESKDEAVVSVFCCAIAKDIEEIEVCVEPHRLILAGKRGLSSGSGDAAIVYRVLLLANEFDPSSVKLTLKQHCSVLEIEIHKLAKTSLIEKNRAA